MHFFPPQIPQELTASEALPPWHICCFWAGVGDPSLQSEMARGPVRALGLDSFPDPIFEQICAQLRVQFWHRFWTNLRPIPTRVLDKCATQIWIHFEPGPGPFLVPDLVHFLCQIWLTPGAGHSPLGAPRGPDCPALNPGSPHFLTRRPPFRNFVQKIETRGRTTFDSEARPEQEP